MSDYHLIVDDSDEYEWDHVPKDLVLHIVNHLDLKDDDKKVIIELFNDVDTGLQGLANDVKAMKPRSIIFVTTTTNRAIRRLKIELLQKINHVSRKMYVTLRLRIAKENNEGEAAISKAVTLNDMLNTGLHLAQNVAHLLSEQDAKANRTLGATDSAAMELAKIKAKSMKTEGVIKALTAAQDVTKKLLDKEELPSQAKRSIKSLEEAEKGLGEIEEPGNIQALIQALSAVYAATNEMFKGKQEVTKTEKMSEIMLTGETFQKECEDLRNMYEKLMMQADKEIGNSLKVYARVAGFLISFLTAFWAVYTWLRPK